MNLKKKARSLFLIWMLLSTGCSSLPGSTQTPLVGPTSSTVQPTQQVNLTESSPAMPTEESPMRLRIWLPPFLNPATDNPAGVVLKKRLDEFQRRNPELIMETRVKAVDGTGGLLDSLTSASAAAPDALPDLVALPRDLLEAAALKGLLQPLGDLTTALDEPDWYPYALELAHLQNDIFGFPFAGDALIQIYHTEQITESLTSWAALLKTGAPLAFSAAAENPLFTLAQYQANGGQVHDEQGRPYLDSAVLSEVLSFFLTAAQSGVMPEELLSTLQTDEQIWDAFSQNQADLIISWTSSYLQNDAENTAVSQIPTPNGKPFTLASGWVWALVGNREEKRLLAVDLAEFLTESKFLAEWSQTAGYLPVRPSSLTHWTDKALIAEVNPIATTARLLPPTDLMASLDTPLQQATLMVLKQQMDPINAAQTAASALTSP